MWQECPRRSPAGGFRAVGSWLVVTGLVFSFMAGIFHSYYTVALAPQVGALVGAGAVLAWRRRADWWVRVVLAGTWPLTAAWAWVLLGRSSSFLPWLRWAVLVVGALAAVALLWPRLSGRVAAAVAVAGDAHRAGGPGRVRGRHHRDPARRRAAHRRAERLGTAVRPRRICRGGLDDRPGRQGDGGSAADGRAGPGTAGGPAGRLRPGTARPGTSQTGQNR